jgi:hypothetical protein
MERLVRSEAVQDKDYATLDYPDLCGTLRDWAASGFRALPRTAERFLRVSAKIESEDASQGTAGENLLEPPSHRIAQMLRPGLSSHDQRILHNLQRREDELAAAELQSLSKAVAQLHTILGVKPRASSLAHEPAMQTG